MYKKFFCEYYPLFFLLVATIISAGCSGDQKVGAVSGMITIDGTPVDLATVCFIPEFGRSSVGKTDEKGRYTLNYVSGRKGALVGKHKVTVSTKYVAETNYSMETYNEEGAIKLSAAEQRRKRGRKETVPKKYRDRDETELMAVVEPGSNEINFDLKSEQR